MDCLHCFDTERTGRKGMVNRGLVAWVLAALMVDLQGSIVNKPDSRCSLKKFL